MRIAFADFLHWDFHVGSVDHIPLGGAHSAACHLARSLARAGHEVTFISKTSQPGVHDGVRCGWWTEFTVPQIRALNFDAVVCILTADRGARMRNVIGPQPRLILWNQHAPDEAGVADLSQAHEREAYDGFVMVSDWQRGQYQQHFGIEPARMTVLRNAIGPAFAQLFAPGESILAQKTQPPVLAYTSTPFRGLDVLLDAFPRIREAVPGTQLQIFSSLRVYQIAPENDEAEHGALYRRCREMEGVEYLGSVSQPELARRLRHVTALSYPSTFAETSCISVMEALASGCRVITSDRAALPETCAGFARLIPSTLSREEYLKRFIEETVAVLRECQTQPDATEQSLRAQVDHMNRTATWDLRATQWVEWLGNLRPHSRPQQAMTIRQAFDLAMQLQGAGRTAEAGAMFWSIIEAQPYHAEALHQLGLISHQEGDEETAERLITRAAASHPLVAPYRHSLGVVLQAQGKSAAAIEAYRMAVQLQPHWTEAQNSLRRAIEHQGP